MRSIIGRRPPLASLLGAPRDELVRGVAAGLAALAPVVAIDIAVAMQPVLPGAYVLGPFAAAIAGSLASTALVAAIAITLGAISPEWNHNFGHLAYWVRLAELLAGAALALLTAWLRERSRAYTRRLALLDQIGAIADGSLSLAETLERAVELVVPAAADFAIIDAIYRGEVTRAAVRARGHPDWARIERGLRSREPTAPFWLRDPGFGIPAVPQFLPKVTSGHVEILGHDSGDRHFLAALRLRSWITVPLIARGRLLGTLTVATAWSKRRYGRDDLRFIRTLSGRLALALDNAGLFTDLESVERRMDAVLDRIPEGVTVHEASGALVYANEPAARLVGAESAAELLRAGAPGRLPRFELYTEDGARLPDGDPVATAIRGGRLPARGVFRLRVGGSAAERWISAAVEPIHGADGALLYAVTTIEDITAARRDELAQRLLANVGELLRSARDYRETLRQAAELAVPGFADWCAVCIPGDDGAIDVAAIAHRDPARAATARQLAEGDGQPLPSASLVRRALGGEPQLVQATDELLRAEGRDPGPRGELRGLGLGTAIVVPMTAGGRTAGALAFLNERESRRFDRHDLEVALEFGRRAGLAAENARLAELRIEIATNLQRGLLPPELPAMSGWQAAAMYRAAGELNEVGGDFYDVFEIESGWMIALGDVVGRGAAAAVLTALARHTIRAVGEISGSPLQALEALNQRLREREPPLLCSVALIVLREGGVSSARAEVVAAGHPLPLLRRGGAVVETAKPGPLLGALAEPRWETTALELEPGDQLVVYTDGVTDARAGEELFGQDRLRAALGGAESPAAVVERVERALAAFCGEDVADDAALIAVMREGGKEPAAPRPERAVAPV
jgi:serine phosphatase RsbU (regulator of sigma subunit)/PAS domain-containing protein